jgi:hypothetical protein
VGGGGGGLQEIVTGSFDIVPEFTFGTGLHF